MFKFPGTFKANISHEFGNNLRGDSFFFEAQGKIREYTGIYKPNWYLVNPLIYSKMKYWSF